MQRVFKICLISIFVIPFCAQGRDSEYKQMLERLNKRYEGFFVYQQEQKRSESRRKSGIPALKKRRVSVEKDKEKIRKSFVRKPPKNREPSRLRWEKKEKAIAVRKEVARKAFVKKRAEIARVKASARKVPERRDVGLEP